MKRILQRHQRDLPTIDLIPFLPIYSIGCVLFVVYFAMFYQLSWLYDWSGIRSEVKETVLEIQEIGLYQNGSRKSEELQTRLKTNATLGELLQLKNYPNGAVRATAYEGLLAQDNIIKYDLLLEALNDTTAFVLGYNLQLLGCYLMEHSVYVLKNIPPPPPDSPMRIGLPKWQEEELVYLYHFRKGKIMDYYKAFFDDRVLSY